MKDVVFYDYSFNRLGDYPGFISFNYEKKYCGYGTAEIHYSLVNSDIITLLETNTELLFVADGNSAIVTGWCVGEDIAIYGRTPEWLFTKRGVIPFSKSGVSAEVIARTAVETTVSDFVVLGEVQNSGEITEYTTNDVKTLYNVVCEVLAPQGLGFRLKADLVQRTFVFEVYKGGESMCVLSPSNRTAYNMCYTVDKSAMVGGCGWYKRRYKNMGNWNAESNSPSLNDSNSTNAYTFYRITSDDYTSSGNRVERFGLWCNKDYYLYSDTPDGKWKITNIKPDTIWIYTGTPKTGGAGKWDAVLSGVRTEAEAKAELAELIRRESSETETKGIKYGEDYNLGDEVRVQLEYGEFKKTERKRITAVNLYTDTNGSGVIPIFEE